MSEVALQASAVAAPPVPISRGPPLRAQRDSVSEACQPPRRPPSRTASREHTPRTQRSANGSLPDSPVATPIVPTAPMQRQGSGAGQQRPPLSPDANAPMSRSNTGGARRLLDQRSTTSLQFIVEDEATAPTGDTESIAFEVMPSSVVKSRRRGSVTTTTEDITFHVEPSEINEQRHGSEAIDLMSEDISFHPESNIPPTRRGESISFCVEPSNTRRSATAASEIDFEVVSSDVQTPVEEDSGAASATKRGPDTPIPHPADEGDGAEGREKLSIVREEPPTEVAKDGMSHHSRTSIKSGGSWASELRDGKLGSTAPPPPATTDADATALALNDSVDGIAPEPVAPTPLRSVVQASAPPEDDGDHEQQQQRQQQRQPAAEKKIHRGGAAVAPAAPRREPTVPRQPVQKSREQLMNDRPWRDASANARRTPSPRKKAKEDGAEAGRSGTPPAKSREQLMSERPWRDGGSARTKSPTWTRKKSAEEQEREAAAARNRTPVRTRSEIMNERPWRTGSPTSRAASPSGAKKAKKKQPVGPPAKTRDRSESPRQHVPTPEPRPSETAESTPLAPRSPRAATAKVVAKPTATTTTPPPVLLRSPWAVLADDVNEWTEMVNQATNLRHILATMRERERSLVRCVRRVDAAEKEGKRIDKELYSARDELVGLRGVDVNGDDLRPPRPASQGTPSLGVSRTASAAPTTATADFATRLYPQTARQAPRYLLGSDGRGARQASVLSDEDVSDTEMEMYAAEVEEWRSERSQLRATKAALVHRSKDLKYHVRRGTNIKSLSALAVTSSRGPLERQGAGSSSHADEHGYDVLAKLRVEAAEACFALDEARERHTGAQSIGQARRRQLRLQYEDTEAKHDALKRQFEQLCQSLDDSIGRARSLSLLVSSGDNPAKREETYSEDGDEGDGWRSPGVVPLREAAPGAGEITEAEASRDTAELLQLRIRQAEDALMAAKIHQKGATPRRAGSRSTSRPGTARARSQATRK